MICFSLNRDRFIACLISVVQANRKAGTLQGVVKRFPDTVAIIVTVLS